MDTFWKLVMWQQFGAAIDMLENAMRACPDRTWSDSSKRPEWPSNGVVGFWYLAYHTLFFLDFYLSDSADGFRPPSPFNLDELDPAGLLPERPFTKMELLTYLEYCRQKCRVTIGSLTEQKARERCGMDWLDLSFAELLLYSMRHVQHHTAQLNLILRQETAAAPRWVAKTKVPITGE
jgi:DinB superfamily